ncbi:tetratricopeptide repeat protein [Aquimarina brevivitae]|uniref:Tetratricopeptide repeat protein n=1 Tax=Aquimarina brevivitae TaxID=323412 RepID=A0A4Q7PEP5_9FLAO|nr:hypothetical protein [Aquimarina brevivitae]RZS98933.1 hypothetical protein EV197_0135 [Aquimarina brevivitae]
MTPEEKYLLFDSYCNDILSQEERQKFSDLLMSDAELKEEFDTYTALHDYLDATFNTSTEEQELKNTLDRVSDTYFKTNKQEHKTKVIKLPNWAYAAAACVAILLGTYFFYPTNPSYADFAAIPQLSLTQRSAEQGTIKEAEQAFNQQNYKAAEILLSTLLHTDKANSELQFYYGLSLLEQNKYNEASDIFMELKNGSSIFKYRAMWFEALNLLKQKKFEACKAVLQAIPKEAEDYEQAQQLLDEL